MKSKVELNRAPQWMDEPDEWRAFAFYSANLQYLLPAVPLKQHRVYFETTRHLQGQHSLQNGFRQLDNLQEAEWAFRIARPAIIATFHTGPYHLMCGWLMRRKIPFSLVLSGDIIRTKAASYHRLYREVTGTAATPEEFGLIDASNPRSLLHMRTAMRNGHLLVLYVDGNTGADSQSGLRMDFLAGTLRVKTGTAYLSYLMQCPVYPVLCHWEGPRARWKAAAPILPRPGEARPPYMQRCMAGVYRLLADTLAQYTPQWEGWLYVHHDVQTDHCAGVPEIPDANTLVERFMPFTLGGATFLLQRDGLQAHPISADLYVNTWRHAKKFFGN